MKWIQQKGQRVQNPVPLTPLGHSLLCGSSAFCPAYSFWTLLFPAVYVNLFSLHALGT